MSEIIQGHLARASDATERVVEHASAIGDVRLVSRTAPPIAYVLLHGPTPVEHAVALCDELLANVRGDRKVEAVIFSTLAVLRAMRGEFDEARDLYRRGLEMLTELGAGTDAASTSIDAHRVELLAGDLEAAERELRRDYDVLTELNESYFRSTIAANLANVRWLQGDASDALRFSEIAEQIADDDDVLAQVPWRIARAAVLAGDGDAPTARGLADAAVELARATELPLLQADALVGQARVLAALEARESSEPPLREALMLYERKGDRVSAAAVRRLLGEAVEVARP
ncbi:MAG: hypothetical protein L0227_01400 [Chloroflexi bacterium]|nr:hypothetical protein [Chloroflexota bacterium]